MTFDDAIRCCHVRSAIFRTGDPTKVFTIEDLNELHVGLRELYVKDLGKIVSKRYWKNNQISLKERVPKEDQLYNDWEEYDPRDEDTCSLYAFND